MTLKPAIFTLPFVLLTALVSPLFADATAAPSAEVVSQLIAQLGDDDYMVRTNAQDVLTSYGSIIKSELENALASVEDPEIYQRLQYILKTIPLIWDEPGDEPELTEFIQNYRRSDPLSKMVVMESLRRLSPEFQIKALDRIIQKEQNNGSIVFAAMAFWYWLPESDTPQYAQLTQAVNDNWKDSKHPALKNLYYLVNYKQLRSEATIWFDKQLQRIAELNRIPSKSAELVPEYIGTILAEFARRKAESMLTDEDLAGEKRINFSTPRFGSSGVTIVNGVVQIQFCISSQIFPVIKNSSSVVFQNNPYNAGLIPLLGPIYLLRLEMSKEAESWLGWELSNPELQAIENRRSISEIFYEYGFYKTAADILERLKIVNNPSNEKVQHLSPSDNGRIAYFRACQANLENNPDKQWEYLVESQKAYNDMDAMIMQWELCQVPANENEITAITDEVRKQVEENIEKRLLELDSEIVNNGTGSFILFNQYAWLAVKTNRHLDKAFLYAKEAVESEPASSAFIDTLAHIYAAKGELDKAIELQEQVVKLEPSSQVLYNNLLNFKKLKEAVGNRQ